METFDKLNDMLIKELDGIVAKGAMTPDCVRIVGEVVDIMKDIKEIEDKSMGGYSQRGYSYDDWNGGHSNRGVRYNRNSYGRGHRRDDREEILDRLDYLMENSGTEQERQAIRQALNTLENM